MFDNNDPRQIAMFPDLDTSASLQSITTRPEFDLALTNLIRICDLGAFIQLNINGIEKGYSFHLGETNIPSDFLKENVPAQPFSANLFSPEVRRQLHKLVYEIKSFFKHDNSIPTSLGPFLFRAHFQEWTDFLEQEQEIMRRTVRHLLGRRTYSKHYLQLFNLGYEQFARAADITAPWEFNDDLTMSDIRSVQSELPKHGHINDLDATEIQFPLKFMAWKTRHIPMKLADYLKQINIHAISKTIHLDYLTDIRINSIDDIRNLTEII